MIFPLFLFAAFRGNGNGDYFAYLDRGVYISTIQDVLYNRKIGMEIGYRWIVYVVRLLRLPRQFVVVFMNAISFSCIATFIKRYSKDWCLSLLLFIPLFFQFDMHAARAAVAIGFCAVGFKYIKERKFVKYIATIVIACMFHLSALISIPLYFFYGKRIKLKSGLLILMVELLVIRFLGIYTLMARLFTLLHLDYFAEKLIAYTSSETYGYTMNLYDPRIWIGIFVFLFSCTTVPEKNEDEIFMTNAVFMYSFILILFSNTTFFAYRLSAFYYIYILLLIPSIVLKYHYHSANEYGYMSHYSERIRLFYFFSMIFSVLNMFYARIMIEYKTVFETGSGLLNY